MFLFIRSSVAVTFVSWLLLASTDLNVQASSNSFRSRGAVNLSMKLNYKMSGSLSRNFRSTRYLTFNGGAADFGHEKIEQEDNSIEHIITEGDSVAANAVNGGSEEKDFTHLSPGAVDDSSVDLKQNNNSNSNIRGGDVQNSDSLKSTISNEPIRISTNRKFGTRRNSSNRNQLGKISRKERREQKRKQKLEDKSHRQIAKKLKNRNSLNIKRKFLHAGFGFFFATLNQIIPKSIFVPGMTFVTSLALFVELMRYRKGWGFLNDIMHFFLGGSLRKHEMEGKFTGSFYYFLGVTITSALFPTSCATLGIMQLALADPSASFFGSQTKHIYWSRIENGFFGIGRNKGVLGFLGGAAFCFPFNYYVLSIAKYGAAAAIPGGTANLVKASIALGIAGAFADLCVPTPALTMPKKIYGVPVPPFHVDDNVVVPILSGYACTKIFESLGWTTVDLAKWILF